MPPKPYYLIAALLLSAGLTAQLPARAEKPSQSTLRKQFEPAPSVFAGLHKAHLEECARNCDFDAVTEPVTVSESYIQSYETKPYKDDGETFVDDAGVAVYAFRNAAELNEAVSQLYGQPSFIFLTKGPYLIMVWSDSSRAQEAHFAAARRYYEKLGAEFFEAPEDQSRVTDVVQAEESGDAVKDAVDASGEPVVDVAAMAADAAAEAAEAARPAAEAAAAAARIAACAAKATTEAGEIACAAAEAAAQAADAAAAAADAAATSQSDDVINEDAEEEADPEAAAGAEACCSS